MSAPIDVFVKVWPQHPLRERMAGLVLERLRMLEGIRLFALMHETGGPDALANLGFTGATCIAIGRQRYHEWTKFGAAQIAQSDVYVVMDDDHLPIARDWAVRGARVLLEHPRYALLASWSVNGEVVPELVQGSLPGRPEDDDEVFESIGLGTPYFARSGQIQPESFLIPDTTAHTYDPRMSAMARDHGRLGFLKGVRHNHLGIGFSTVSEAHWEA